MKSRLLVIQSDRLSKNDTALSALSEFMGVPADFTHFNRLLAASSPIRGHESERVRVALSGDTLTAMLQQEALTRFGHFLASRVSSLLLYGVQEGPFIDDAVRQVTAGVVRRVASPGNGGGEAYEVGRDGQGVCGPLAGLRIGPVHSRDHVLQIDEGNRNVEALISVEQLPCFARLQMQDYELFIAAGSEVADVREKITEQLNMRQVFSGLFPSAMYIKHAFKQASWHADRSRACLVVDDPLLRKTYGFLDYDRLLNLMDTFNFSTSIAFIPWNFRRTHRDIANLFINRPDRFSVCVHGCDHTKNEFGSFDEASLNDTISTATRRMNDHKRTTGVGFDRVMVFPQGIFSTHSMAMLKANNYLAAVNAETIPVDMKEPVEMRIFLEPALMAYGAFPLFQRRFPEQVTEVAMDLFWGRPALVLAHHDFFKKSCHEVVETVSRINGLDSTLEWTGLGDIIRRSHLQREDGPEVTVVRSYVTETVMKNRSDRKRRYLFTKEESGCPPVSAVRADGKELAYTLSDGVLSASLELPPGRKAEIRIGYADCPGHIRHSTTRGQEVKVLVRRYLSEMRDNYLSKSEVMLTLATKLKNALLP